MFSNIIVYGSTDREAEKAASILSKTAYFRVSSLGAYRRWNGAIETGKGPNLAALKK